MRPSKHSRTRAATFVLCSPYFGDRDPHTLTRADIQGWINSSSDRGLKWNTIRLRLSTLRQVLLHADVEPNPAYDRRVKLPKRDAEETTPPSADEFLAILREVPKNLRLGLITLEQTATRTEEVGKVRRKDMDQVERRFRLSKLSTKTKRARWVEVPEWLMERIAATAPAGPDPNVLLLPRHESWRLSLAMLNARRAAGVAGEFTPKTLRHRRATLWHLKAVRRPGSPRTVSVMHWRARRWIITPTFWSTDERSRFMSS